MATTINEFFGFPAGDQSVIAKDHIEREICPFLGSRCTKTLSDGIIAGVCSLRPVTSGPVICCPNRLYADDYAILSDIATIAFGPGIPLEPGGTASKVAVESGAEVVAVFGKGWGGELRLPQRQGQGAYFVDWILARLRPDGTLLEFVAVEVQSIDTTGNYRGARTALLEGRAMERSSAAFNWENVSKRILPQLLYKGNVLQREELCRGGLFFVSPSPVHHRIMKRLGGQESLLEYPLQSSSLTFLSYGFDETQARAGYPTSLRLENRFTTNINQVAAAFAGPGVMPSANVYQTAILTALGRNAG